MKKTLITFCSFLLLAALPCSVNAHSGGTDKYGCHAGSQPYHCHNGTDSSDSGTQIYQKSIRHFRENDSMYSAPGVRVPTFRNCRLLNRRYLAGIARSFDDAMPFLMKISRLAYNANKRLDRNKDGVACGILEPEGATLQTFSCINGPLPPATTTTTTVEPAPTTTTTTMPSALARFYPSTTAAPAPTPTTPCGQTATVNTNEGPWDVQVVAVTPNSQTAILIYHPSNLQALPGKTYVTATIRGTNRSTRARYFDPPMMFSAKTPSGKTYDSFGLASCGITPDKLEKLRPNRSGVNYACWQVDIADANNLILEYKYLLGSSSIRLSLDPSTRINVP